MGSLGIGGGIYSSNNSDTSDLTVINSIITNNSAYSGGFLNAKLNKINLISSVFE